MSDESDRLNEKEARYILGHPLFKLTMDRIRDGQIQLLEDADLSNTNQLVAITALIQNKKAFEDEFRRHIETLALDNQPQERY